jgi:hypothetical protein
MVGACGTYGAKERHIKFLVEKCGEKRPHGWEVSTWLYATKTVGWIELDCVRDKWRALVNTGLNLCIP